MISLSQKGFCLRARFNSLKKCLTTMENGRRIEVCVGKDSQGGSQ